jgi:hypothetical protein
MNCSGKDENAKDGAKPANDDMANSSARPKNPQ